MSWCLRAQVSWYPACLMSFIRLGGEDSRRGDGMRSFSLSALGGRPSLRVCWWLLREADTCWRQNRQDLIKTRVMLEKELKTLKL